MKDKKNNYDFDLASNSGSFGFEVFQNADNGRYYFHFNDQNGEAFLYSQAYQSAKSRDHGLRAVIKNAPNSQRYLKEKEGDRHYFLLKSGNHQEIARSKAFDSRSKMNECLALLSDIDASTPIHSFGESGENTLEEKITRKKPQKPIAKTEDIEQMPRHSFRINLYPESRRGLITHIFSGENRHFQNIDGKEIVDFIRSHSDLPASEAQIPAEQVSSRSLQSPTPDPVERRPATVVVPKSKAPITVKDVQFQLWLRDQEVSGKTVRRSEFYRLALQLDKLEDDVEAVFDTKIIAKPLEPGRGVQIIMEEHGNLNARGELSFPLSFRRLPDNGFYKVTAFISMKNQKTTYQADRLLFVD